GFQVLIQITKLRNCEITDVYPSYDDRRSEKQDTSVVQDWALLRDWARGRAWRGLPSGIARHPRRTHENWRGQRLLPFRIDRHGSAGHYLCWRADAAGDRRPYQNPRVCHHQPRHGE